MNLHRVKHIPFGLYYKPGENNLSEKGRIYSSNQDILVGDAKYIGISMHKSSKLIKKYPKFLRIGKMNQAFTAKEFLKESQKINL